MGTPIGEWKIILPTLSPKKLWNAGKIALSYFLSRLTGRLFHFGMPVSIGIEPTTGCNLRCPQCPSGLRIFGRPTGMLDPQNFRKLVDEVHDELIYLILYFQGEPYLNVNFLEMVKYAAQKQIFTSTSTNAHFLTPETAQKTVESGLHKVIISIDGTTQETYQKYRVGGNLQKVIDGTKHLVEAKRNANSQTPYILWQFIVFKHNEHQISDVIKLGKELGVDEVAIKTAQIYDYITGNEMIPENEEFSRYELAEDGTYRLKHQLLNHCWKLWQGAEITLLF